MKVKGYEIDINNIVNIAKDAGEKILEIYNKKSFDQQLKIDNSPITDADVAAHNLIQKRLEIITPAIPILSEESSSISWQERKKWDCHWLVDPLDGTKEFIKKNGEFTVNIALIYKHNPILGVVHAPVLNKTWLGERSKPARKISQDGTLTIKAKHHIKNEIYKVVGSRSHAGDSLNEFLNKLGKHEIVSMGSSIKL